MKSKNVMERLNRWELKIVLPRIEPIFKKSTLKSLSKFQIDYSTYKENIFYPFRIMIPQINLSKIDCIPELNRQVYSEFTAEKQDEKYNNVKRGISCYTRSCKFRIHTLDSEKNGLSSSRSIQNMQSNRKISRNHSMKTRQSILHDLKNINSPVNFSYCLQPKKIKKIYNETFVDQLHKSDFTPIENFTQNCNMTHLISHSAHKCTENLKHEVNNIQIENKGSKRVQKKLVIKVQQYCVSQPKKTTLLKNTSVSTATTERNVEKSKKTNKKNIEVHQSTGINVHIRKFGMEKFCTKIIESKYTETVEQYVNDCTNSRRITRQATAKGLNNNFFSLSMSTNKVLIETLDTDESENNKMEKMKTKQKKKLNVSFKDLQPLSPSKSRRIENQNHNESLESQKSIELPKKNVLREVTFNEIRPQRNTKSSKYFPYSDELSENSPHPRSQKRMTRREAAKKTAEYNEDQKHAKNYSILKNKNSSRKRRKRSSDHEYENISVPLEVSVSERTPNSRLKKQKQQNDSFMTPCVVLEKLNETIGSTYAITPLREERIPLPSKTSEDYGIDDVNTDDSTDEEDNPKKMLPEWAKHIGNQPEVQYYCSTKLKKSWMQPPKVGFTVKSLFF